MSDHEQTIAKAHRAAAEYRELEAAFTRCEQAYVAELLRTPMGADEKVLGLHMAIRNLHGVKEALLQAVQAGSVSQELIDRAAKRRTGPY